MNSAVLVGQITTLARAAGRVAAEIEAYGAFERMLVRSIGDLADDDPELADEAAEHLAGIMLDVEGERGPWLRWDSLAEQLEALSGMISTF